MDLNSILNKRGNRWAEYRLPLGVSADASSIGVKAARLTCYLEC